MKVNGIASAKIKDFRNSDVDTGSTQVQILGLTDRILSVAQHVERNHKDQSARRSLNILVGNRRRLLSYLKRRSVSMFERVSSAIESK